MAKSIRAKAKMASRARKRVQGNYHAADAARLARLSSRLTGKKQADGTVEGKEGEEGEEVAVEGDNDAEMQDVADAPKKVSTSAPRDSRREAWRSAKGLSARPKSRGQNSLGVAKGRRNSGKPKRRR